MSGEIRLRIGYVSTVSLLVLAVGVASYAQPPSRPLVIVWQGAEPAVCVGYYTAQAVVFGRSGSEGCSRTWLVVLPSAERGNLTQEATWFAQHSTDYVGVIMDDPSTTDLPAYLSFKTYTPNVCPVLYIPVRSVPNATLYGDCVTVVVRLHYDAATTGLTPQIENGMTISQWTSLIDQSLVNIRAPHVLLLGYAEFPKGWGTIGGKVITQIPLNYVAAIKAEAPNVWGLIWWY